MQRAQREPDPPPPPPPAAPSRPSFGSLLARWCATPARPVVVPCHPVACSSVPCGCDGRELFLPCDGARLGVSVITHLPETYPSTPPPPRASATRLASLPYPDEPFLTWRAFLNLGADHVCVIVALFSVFLWPRRRAVSRSHRAAHLGGGGGACPARALPPALLPRCAEQTRGAHHRYGGAAGGASAFRLCALPCLARARSHARARARPPVLCLMWGACTACVLMHVLPSTPWRRGTRLGGGLLPHRGVDVGDNPRAELVGGAGCVWRAGLRLRASRDWCVLFSRGHDV